MREISVPPFDEIVVSEEALARLRDRLTGIAQHSPLQVRISGARLLQPGQALLLLGGRVVQVLNLERQ